ncbi:phytoene/squalene synthase family protein [Vagococcus vulneris]|uniref:Phytoene desaturase n=1 Tax=Vagococcus vulneris TaxID=1977869 RepID=A0A429ZYC4_9ENTE|nr:phytoene/squalene synthase family protein [Vagococcus vulneris]RST98950.1 phytoene desaturase [Vagococcus vulneris]
MIFESPNRFDKNKDDFDYCEKIIKRESKSFYAAFAQLPKEKAQSVYAIYAFCRLADDIVDDEKSSKKLAELHEQLVLFSQGQILNTPLWRALNVVFETFPIPIQPFFDMLFGQKMDLLFKQPKTKQDLLDYAYYVAGSVGLMLLPIISSTPETISNPAKKLGEAMQLTNILRDIGEDLQNHRIYLPQEDMQACHVTVHDLEDKKISPQFIQLWESLAATAEKLYDDSLEMMPFIDRDAYKPLISAILVYRELLNKIRTKHYDVFNTRQVVSSRKKLILIQSIKNPA